MRSVITDGVINGMGVGVTAGRITIGVEVGSAAITVGGTTGPLVGSATGPLDGKITGVDTKAGFEKIMQAATLRATWQVTLHAGKAQTLDIRLRVKR